MSVVVDVDLEENDLSDFDSTETDGGDLSVAAGAALANTAYGLSVDIDDTNAIYGANAISLAAQFRARFYIDPNNMTIGDGDSFFVFTLYNSTPTYVGGIRLGNTGGTFQIRAYIWDDAGSSHGTDDNAISDAEHYVEALWERDAVNGQVTLWIDGVEVDSSNTCDSYDRWTADMETRLGAPLGLDAGTSGTPYLDELIVNNDGSEIGPRIGVPIFMRSYRQRRVS